MPEASRKRLQRTTVIYWLLLLYILAALVWWFISLNNQNNMMESFEISNLRSRVDSVANPAMFMRSKEHILREHRQNTSKFVGEGSIFMLLILVGAAFVYRSVRRQFNMQQQQQNFMMDVT